MIGIRREDKSRWEARVPLVPDDLQRLIGAQGLAFTVQTSPIRAIPPQAFAAAGAAVADDLAGCPIVVGVKEIPKELFERGKVYVFFSHTIKGQPANMPMLRRLMELGCTLIDYERIVDSSGRRLVFFGRFAGLAGMIETLWALGQRLKLEGVANPFERVQRAHQYRDLAHAKDEVSAIGAAIRRAGLPPALRPLVIGLTGYGNVSLGAQEILDLLPVQTVAPDELERLPADGGCYKVVFKEEHLVARRDPSRPFELQEYYKQPELYRSKFFPHVRHLTALVNCIYWEPKYPRLITNAELRELWAARTLPQPLPRREGSVKPPRLRVIGDISCDINGSIECTVKATEPGAPTFVYEPATGQVRDGLAGDGPVVMAVDILPCELPVDASRHFSHALSPFMPALAKANFAGSFEQSGLPEELKRATIVWRGELTEGYKYLKRHVV
jgi:saccharopine dehydrogenase (NAD+, L-lysine forming)